MSEQVPVAQQATHVTCGRPVPKFKHHCQVCYGAISAKCHREGHAAHCEVCGKEMHPFHGCSNRDHQSVNGINVAAEACALEKTPLEIIEKHLRGWTDPVEPGAKESIERLTLLKEYYETHPKENVKPKNKIPEDLQRQVAGISKPITESPTISSKVAKEEIRAKILANKAKKFGGKVPSIPKARKAKTSMPLQQIDEQETEEQGKKGKKGGKKG